MSKLQHDAEKAKLAREIRHRLLDTDDDIADIIAAIYTNIAAINRRIEKLEKSNTKAIVQDAHLELVSSIISQTGDTYQYSRSIDADQALDTADGFYHLEWADNGKPYRWTGPSNQFSFKLHAPRIKRLTFNLHLIGKVDHCNLNNISAQADSTVVKTETLEGEDKVIISGIIEPDSMLLRELTFVVPEMKQTEEQDGRIIGIPITRLEIYSL